MLAVAGLAPAVITETLWALGRRGDGGAVDEVHVLTTTRGAVLIERSLAGESGALQRLAADWALPVPALHLHLVHRDGEALDDIRDADDYTALADTLVGLVARLTADPQTRIHASLAGGRKSMTFYLGYLMSLFGRARDELSHVLVLPAELERCPDFFYPAPTPRPVGCLDAGTGRRVEIDAAAARIDLAPIPFVRLRYRLSAAERDVLRRQRFTDVVAAVDEAVAPPTLELVPATRTVRARGRAFVLPHREFALLWLLARRRVAAVPAIDSAEMPPGWLAAGAFGEERAAEIIEFMDLYDRLVGSEVRGERRFRDRLREAAQLGDTAAGQKMRRDLFAEVKSKLKKALARALPDPMLRQPFQIEEQRIARTRGHCFGLALPAGAITIVDAPSSCADTPTVRSTS